LKNKEVMDKKSESDRLLVEEKRKIKNEAEDRKLKSRKELKVRKTILIDNINKIVGEHKEEENKSKELDKINREKE
jgi:hypothetical protein